ncbi:hypothetical protein C8R45DRAFT_1101211 [Mycena sanguinolenta]|nr:hypothetical protein C8R45DRAFT_1101211 [Mycena sanguinolenta]
MFSESTWTRRARRHRGRPPSKPPKTMPTYHERLRPRIPRTPSTPQGWGPPAWPSPDYPEGWGGWGSTPQWDDSVLGASSEQKQNKHFSARYYTLQLTRQTILRKDIIHLVFESENSVYQGPVNSTQPRQLESTTNTPSFVTIFCNLIPTISGRLKPGKKGGILICLTTMHRRSLMGTNRFGPYDTLAGAWHHGHQSAIGVQDTGVWDRVAGDESDHSGTFPLANMSFVGRDRKACGTSNGTSSSSCLHMAEGLPTFPGTQNLRLVHLEFWETEGGYIVTARRLAARKSAQKYRDRNREYLATRARQRRAMTKSRKDSAALAECLRLSLSLKAEAAALPKGYTYSEARALKLLPKDDIKGDGSEGDDSQDEEESAIDIGEDNTF